MQQTTVTEMDGLGRLLLGAVHSGVLTVRETPDGYQLIMKKNGMINTLLSTPKLAPNEQLSDESLSLLLAGAENATARSKAVQLGERKSEFDIAPMTPEQRRSTFRIVS